MSRTLKTTKREALTTGVQDRIILLIQGWKTEWGDLSASALERKVRCCLGISTTRQGMLKKEAIKAAFDQRIKQGAKPIKTKPAAEVLLQQRVDRLEQELAEKERQIEGLQDMLARFRYNAKLMGLAAERLEAQIAPLTGSTSNGA